MANKSMSVLTVGGEDYTINDPNIANEFSASTNYEKGDFARIRISYNDANRTLTIGQRQGQYNGMPQTQQFNIVLVTSEKPVKFGYKAKPVKTVKYDGQEQSVNL